MFEHRPDIVDGQKASSHPLAPGRIYSATVTAVTPKGQVSITIPAIGSDYGPLTPLNVTPLNKYVIGDVVACAFTDEFFNEIIVFGSLKIKPDVWASKTTVEALSASVTSLQAALSTHTHNYAATNHTHS